MADLSLSGLATGFDWKSLVDQLMQLEHAPVDKLSAEKTTNGQKVTALSGLGTKLTALQGSLTALQGVGLFSERTATLTSSGSTWSASVVAGAATGGYEIAVSQLATAARREGSADLAAGLAPTADVSGLTLANFRTATAVTAGAFTVNGAKVTVALTDSLADVFAAISDATGGEVTATYDPAADRVTLTGATGPVTLGAANDTSNFLAAFRLGNNGTDTITSAGALGALQTTAPLSAAGLRAAVTAVDSSGNGSFTINGVTIDYNVDTDSLSAVLGRINASTAGVTATYDAAEDRVVLTNKTTGDVGLGFSEAAGGLLSALGVTGGTFVRGRNAEFTVNGGATRTSFSNTLDAAALGVPGLTVTVNSAATQTVQVASNTGAMRGAINDFIAKFNDVQAYIDAKTQITSANGTVTTSILSDNREIQGWQGQLRALAFGPVSGLSGTIQRLENLGIDFDSSSYTLSVKDDTKLGAALADHADDVAAFFQTASTGFAAKFNTLVTKLSGQTDGQQQRLNAASKDLDRQIADMERRLDQQRQLLTDSFIRMEDAQSKIQSQSAALTKAFSSSS